MAENQIEVPIGIDSKPLERDLKSVERSFSNFGKSLQNSFKLGQQGLETFKGTLAGLAAFKAGELIVSGFAKAFSFLSNTFKESITAANEADVALNNLNSALERTGRFTPQLSKDLQEFATQLQRTSTFTDEAAQESLAYLATLTKLDGDGLKTATQAAADLATVLNVDLQTATKLVAKAANGKVETFARYGIEIEKGTSKTETFANALKAFANFEGAAQSRTRTFAGSIQQLSNNYGDLLEAFGKTLTNSPAVIGLFNAINKSVVALGQAVSSNDFGSVIKTSILATISALEALLDITDFVVRTFRVAWNGIFLIIDGAVSGIIGGISTLVDAFISLGSQLPVVGELFQKVTNPLRDLADGLFNVAAADAKGFTDALSNQTVFADFSDGLAQIRKETNAFAAEAAVRGKGDKKSVLGFDPEAEAEVSRQVLDARRNLQIELDAINQQAVLQNDELRAQRILAEDANNVNELAKLQAVETEKILIQARAEEEKARLIQDSFQREQTLNKIAATTSVAIKKKQLADELALEQARRAQLNQNLTATSQFLQAGILLAKQNSKEQQALAIANALVSTYQAITNALATKPFIPAGLSAAALAGAQGFAAVRNITSQKFENGGIVGGNSFTGDKVTVGVNSGEMILNKNQQQEMFKQLNGGGSGGNSKMDEMIAAIKSQPIVVSIDGREIVRAVRDQLGQGMRLA